MKTITMSNPFDKPHGAYKHGCAQRGKKTAAYYSWASMKSRCICKTNEEYPNYGGAGITVCERWLVFENFLADMGERPVGTTLDRKDTLGNYEPSNCRWATDAEQCRNRSSSIWIEYAGAKHTLKEWSDLLGIPYARLYKRVVVRGWDIAKAFEYPAQQEAL